ncbi:hypothetical protein [uncultured Tolumonas sp.]|uniref:hypothetical protein n=1 Tax=uncultured Tolumonas sp. TaxID=263765 RepID=UPI00292E9489|nr:hypothetical protein [uncultured Tolumonas sp.]
MNKFKINCSRCGLKLSMLLPSRPHKCPKCNELLRFRDVDGGLTQNVGINLSNNFSTGAASYLHADGDCSVISNNDVILGADKIVTALNGAKVEMNDATIDKTPTFPDSINFCGFNISPPRVFILQTIVRNVIGIENTNTMTSQELINFFQVVQNRILNGLVDGLNGGSITGIRNLHSDGFDKIEIINSDDKLTEHGVKLFKYIAQISA